MNNIAIQNFLIYAVQSRKNGNQNICILILNELS